VRDSGVFTTQILISLEDVETVNRIIVGCTKIVYWIYGPESQWTNFILKHLLSPSKEQLVQVFFNDILDYPSLSLIPKEIESKYSDQVEQVDHATVSRSLQRYVKCNILEITNESQNRRRGPGRPGRNDGTRPGPVSVYSATESEIAIRKFVLRPVPRGLIYGALYESDVLTQYLKFHHYVNMIYCKYANVKEYLRSKKAKVVMDSELLDNRTTQFLNNQEFFRQKSDKDIMKRATNLANSDVIKQNWEKDELYTNFFISGWRCYPVMEFSNI
jgi:hypothetical protein